MPGADLRQRAAMPLSIFALCAALYAATLGSRIDGVSSDAHFLYLAESFLHGQLHLVADAPPHQNDWARYDGRWYVSFPPFPALLVTPLVALFGVAAWDRLFWAVFAGLGPALLFVLLRHLRESGHSPRSQREDLLLTALFAFGSVYYYTAVQGTVWHAAHVVACPLIALYLLWAVDARRPLLAGLALGLAFMTRPTTLLLGLVFAFEALRKSARASDVAPGPGPRVLAQLDLRGLLSRVALFALPLLFIGAVAMVLNYARFDNPFEFGHSHLKIRWRARIDTWGLFNYHYLSRNLAVMLASLPWLKAGAPYVEIGRHGIALWCTTPQLLWLLWPQRSSPLLRALAVGAGAVALLDLCYQNSGWIQFGYRFSLDYAVVLFAMLALGRVRFGKLFHALLPLALAVNLFGAITFDRVQRFYDNDATQKVLFQPD
ncbi:MAG: hypothetical protein OEZ06_08065 [Myxococcales bacterium]|nr:hypothetical protein [Myxococcales bacterium]